MESLEPDTLLKLVKTFLKLVKIQTKAVHFKVSRTKSRVWMPVKPRQASLQQFETRVTSEGNKVFALNQRFMRVQPSVHGCLTDGCHLSLPPRCLSGDLTVAVLLRRHS